VLITGSSGMLGVDLCGELHDSYEIIGTDVVHRCRAGLNLPYSRKARSFFRCDITKKQSVLSVIKKTRPDIVIHAAAWTDVDGCELNPKKAYRINSEGTKNVALACKAAGAILIYISTDFIFDGRKKKPYKEADKVNPLSVYADSKLKGEEAVKKILKDYFILRTGWLYGKHGKNFVDTILAKAKPFGKGSGLRPERSRGTKSRKVLRVVNDQVGSPTYTRDLVKAIHVLLEMVTRLPGHQVTSSSSRAHFSVPYGIYHLSNSMSVSWFNYAKEILRLAGSKAKVMPISSEELNRPAKRPAMSVLDNTKFIKFTGYRMCKWQEALREYIHPGV